RRERATPESLGRDCSVERRQLLALGHGAALRLGVEIDHRVRYGEALDVEVAADDPHAALSTSRLPSGLDDSHPLGVGAGLRLEIDAEVRRLAARVPKEREGLVVGRARDVAPVSTYL